MSDTPKNDPDDLDFDDDFLEDDDLLDEELELDELDDDLEVEGEEPLDDSFDDDLSDEFDDDVLAAEEAPTPAKKKSFFSRHFNSIVIGGAVIIGGLFIFNTVLAPTPSQQTQSTSAPQQQANAPAATAQEQPVNLDLESLRNFDDQQEAVLPYAEEIAQLDAQRVINADDGSSAPSMLDPNVLSEEDDLFAELGGVDTAPVNDAAAEADVAQDDVALLPLPDLVDNETALETTPLPPLEPAEAEPVIIDDIVVQDDLNIIPVTPDPLPTIDNERIATLESDLIAMQAEIERLNARNTMLEGALDAKDQTAETLEQQVARLQSDLAAAQKKAQAAQKPEQAAPKVQAVAEPKRQEPQKIQPKPQAKAPQWVMRSARSGHAVLANQDTGDLLKISVGDRVPGLGTIQSVRFDTGRWIVQGSQNNLIR